MSIAIRSRGGAERRFRLRDLSARLLWLLTVAACAPCTSHLRSPASEPIEVLPGFHNPEDVAFVVDEGLVLVSNTVQSGCGTQVGLGRLTSLRIDALKRDPVYAWPRGDGEVFQPTEVGEPQCRLDVPEECRQLLAQYFSPHGIAVRQGEKGIEVAVVNHRPKLSDVPPGCADAFDGRDAIELLEFVPPSSATDASASSTYQADGSQGASPKILTWRGCVRMPEGTRGNDLAFDPVDGALVVANPAPRKTSSWLFGRLFREGDVRRWETGAGWSVIPGTHLHNPAGVAVTKDALYVGATGSGEILRMGRTGSVDGEGVTSICVGGSPDNLSVTREGTLLVATHTDAWRFAKCGNSGCASPWAVYELSPDLFRYRPLIATDGSRLSLVSAAEKIPAASGGAHERVVLGSVTGPSLGVIEYAPPPWEPRPCCH